MLLYFMVWTLFEEKSLFAISFTRCGADDEDKYLLNSLLISLLNDSSCQSNFIATILIAEQILS